MAGMLPGVELARRRRTSHHQYDRNSREAYLRDPVEPSTNMDETALKARRRLEEKLGGLRSRPSTRQPAEARGSNRMDATRLEKVWRPLLIRRNSRVEVCAICLDDLPSQQQVMNLPCSHRYHSNCLLPWLAAHSNCPCCRTHVQS